MSESKKISDTGQVAGDTVIDSNVTRLTLLEFQKSSRKVESDVATLLRTVEARGKRLTRFEITVVLAAGGVAGLLFLTSLLAKNLTAIHALLAPPLF